MRDTDKALWVAIGGVLCALGVSAIGQGFHPWGDLITGLLGVLALIGGLYVIGAVVFGWPLPGGAQVLGPEQRMILKGLEHLEADGLDLLRQMEAVPGDYLRAYSLWVREAKAFVGSYFTSGHVITFLNMRGLDVSTVGQTGEIPYMRRYLSRLADLKREIQEQS